MRATLASASPRRRWLLAALGWTLTLFPVDGAEEDPRPLPAAWRRALPPCSVRPHPTELALRKARAARERGAPGPILAADTVVVLEGQILGKPRDEGEARAMLAALSGRSHRVLTGVAWLPPDGPPRLALEEARVTFRRLTEAEIAAYVASGEPLDKAGAYGIQGAARAFVRRVEGCLATVVGLPLCRVAALAGRPEAEAVAACRRELLAPLGLGCPLGKADAP